MNLYLLQAPPWIKKRLELPSGQEALGLIRLNLGVLVLILTLGGPLGDLKRMGLSVWTPIYVLCSAEVICTLVSAAQLLLTAWVLREIYLLRREQVNGQDGRSARLWFLMYVGFLFLAVDEVAFLHEGMARLIRWAGQVRLTWVTDRIDDVIPLVYAVLGLGVLAYFRKELARFRGFWPLLAVGTVFVLGHVALDIITHRKDMLWWWLGKQRAPFWWAKLNALEESSKLLAEAVFLGMFLRCLDTVRQMGIPSVADGEPLRFVTARKPPLRIAYQQPLKAAA